MTFDRLIERDRKYLFSHALSLTRGNRDEAEELTQETAIKMLNAFPRFHGRCSFATWGMSIMTNTLRDKIRQQKAHKNAPLEEAALYANDPKDDVHALLEVGLRNKELMRAVHSLKPYEQELVAMWVRGMSAEEMAAVTGEHYACVRTRLHRAKQKLRIYFEQPINGRPYNRVKR
jgi:RNA polymerase sigma-70 factor, ECF subfamily